MAICSPNYLHDAHIRFCLRNHAHAICEKPLVLNPWNLDALEEVEKENDKKVYRILQLRLHPVIIALSEKYKNHTGDIVDVDITYITSRGSWYYQSWKGDFDKSGGIATNIGIHFFDMLYWIFGEQISSLVHINNKDCASGILQLKNVRVRWFLSINAEHLLEEQKQKGQRTFISIMIDGVEVEFSDGFNNLNTESYKHILNKEGFGLNDARHSIEMLYDIRNAALIPLTGDYHPFINNNV
jgi:UDP-N-acetyl-2-amino-2-deoxyglucuronate dehydrogenase